MTDLPAELQQKLRDELKVNEKTIWTGQPDPNEIMKQGFKLYYFFIPWTLFALFWIYGASGFKMPTFNFQNGFDAFGTLFPLFGLPFVMVGFWGLTSPVWVKRRAENTVYAITNQRLLLLMFGKNTKIESYYPKDVNQLERNEKPDGSGDLLFATKQYRDSDGDARTKSDGFYAVADVKNVERLVEIFLKQNEVIT
jgi:hypothetical protein